MRASPAAVFFRGVEPEASERHATRSRPLARAYLRQVIDELYAILSATAWANLHPMHARDLR